MGQVKSLLYNTLSPLEPAEVTGALGAAGGGGGGGGSLASHSVNTMRKDTHRQHNPTSVSPGDRDPFTSVLFWG